MQFIVYIKQWQGATKIKGNFRFRSNINEPLECINTERKRKNSLIIPPTQCVQNMEFTLRFRLVKAWPRNGLL